MQSTFSSDEICNIAKNQRTILWAILVNILTFVVSLFKILPVEIIGMINLAMIICIIVFLVKLRNAMKKNIVLTIISCIFMILPLLSLIILLVNSQCAIGILKNAGLNVGLLGVSKTELTKFMETSNTDE